MQALFSLIHLHLNSMTRVVIDGRELLIQKKTTQSLWKISTPIVEGRGEFPKEANECLKMIQHLRWDNEGSLEIDDVIGMIHWTKEVCPADFGKELPRFLKHAQEWAEILKAELILC